MGIISGGAATAAKWSEHGPRDGCSICADAVDFERHDDTAVSFAAGRAGMGGMQMGQADVHKNQVRYAVTGGRVRGSPAMAMDAMVEKPETHGLRPDGAGTCRG